MYASNDGNVTGVKFPGKFFINKKLSKFYFELFFIILYTVRISKVAWK